MSSFISNYLLQVFATACTIVSAFSIWWFYFRHWHVGFGTSLRFRDSDGTVWISSRLLGSPAYRHGIEGREQLISVNNHQMKFANGEEFLRWMMSHKAVLSRKERWILKQRGETKIVVMEPERIKTSVPAHWNPNESENPSAPCDWRMRRSLRFCVKTGEYIPSYSLSNEAIVQTFFR